MRRYYANSRLPTRLPELYGGQESYGGQVSYRAKSWDKVRRVVAKVEWHPGELVPRVGLDPLCGSSVTNLNRPTERVVAFYNQRGKAEQSIKGEARRAMNQERDKMDAAVLRQVPRQRRPAPASRPNLQSGQLHADAGLTEGGGALVADDATSLCG